MRTVGFVVASKLATVTPSHRAVSSSSLETLQSRAKQPRRDCNTLHPNGSESLFSRPARLGRVGATGWSATWTGTPVRQRVQEAVGAHAGWTAFIDSVEEEFMGAFLIAPDDADALCGRSQARALVWQACKSPCCDKFPRGNHELQSWRRKSSVCSHITA